MSESILIKRSFLEEGLKIIHDIMTSSEDIPEKVRIKLITWRTDLEWHLENLDR